MVHRAKPSGRSLHTIATIRCFWLFSSKDRRARPPLFIKNAFQTAPLVAMANRLSQFRGKFMTTFTLIGDGQRSDFYYFY
jgi:hypothetical protein